MTEKSIFITSTIYTNLTVNVRLISGNVLHLVERMIFKTQYNKCL